MGFAKDPNRVRLTAGVINYYEEYTTTNVYVERVLGGACNEFVLTNDSETDTVQYSWNGATLEGDIKPGEVVSFKAPGKTSIYLKATVGGDTVRIWAW